LKETGSCPGLERSRERVVVGTCLCQRARLLGILALLSRPRVKREINPGYLSVSRIRVSLAPHPRASSLQCPPMLAEAIREARRKRGWSVLHLSKRSGVPRGVISQIECESLSSYVPSEGNTLRFWEKPLRCR
jgi:hypothetical protein